MAICGAKRSSLHRCSFLKTQPSRSFGSGSGAHLKNKPSRALLESLDQILTAAAASAASTPISATQDLESCRDAVPESPAGSPLPFSDERAALPVNLTTGRLQHNQKMVTFEKPSSFKWRLGQCTRRDAQA